MVPEIVAFCSTRSCENANAELANPVETNVYSRAGLAQVSVAVLGP